MAGGCKGRPACTAQLSAAHCSLLPPNTQDVTSHICFTCTLFFFVFVSNTFKFPTETAILCVSEASRAVQPEKERDVQRTLRTKGNGRAAVSACTDSQTHIRMCPSTHGFVSSHPSLTPQACVDWHVFCLRLSLVRNQSNSWKRGIEQHNDLCRLMYY